MDAEQQAPAQSAVPPSGRQYTIAFGEQLAVVTEVGASLRRYRAGDRDLLDGYGEDEMCTGARGQSLIPWPNRIRHGRYSWHGRTEQLDLSEPAKGGAIHGLNRWGNWELEQVGPRTIDAALVRVPGTVNLPVDEEGIPTGRERVDGTPYDLRALQPLGEREIDVTYHDLERDADGRARVHLAPPDDAPGTVLVPGQAHTASWGVEPRAEGRRN